MVNQNLTGLYFRIRIIRFYFAEECYCDTSQDASVLIY